jgi:hypothetical protein
LRPVPLVSLTLSLTAAALVAAGPVAAQDQDVDPCEFFTSCTEIDRGWVASGDGTSLYKIACPSGEFAVGSDAAGNLSRLGVGGGTMTALGPGTSGSFVFGLVPETPNVTWKPAVGCLKNGAMLSLARRSPRPYRTPVRTRRIRPGVELRVRHRCARGERLVSSGSGVAFFTQRPPSPATVKALEHRHRRRGSVTWTHVAAPPGVGDDERVELQVTAICSQARVPGGAEDSTCMYFSDCTSTTGPWVTAPGGRGIYNVVCPSNSGQDTFAVGYGAVFSPSSPVKYPVATLTPGAGEPGLWFGILVPPQEQNVPPVTYQPSIGCAPDGACFFCVAPAGFMRPAGSPSPYRTRVRTRRIRPGAAVGVRLRCARGWRLGQSGSAIAFFTRRPPSPAIVKALRHRHRRSGSLTRTVAAAPPGVGDDERVELQVTVFCSRRR